MDDQQRQTNFWAIIAAAFLGAAADSVWQQIGVVAVGAIFGSFWGVSQLRGNSFGEAIWVMGARFAFSFCTCWIPALLLEAWLLDHGKFGVPANVALLLMSFILASPREFSREVAPLVKLVRRKE